MSELNMLPFEEAAPIECQESRDCDSIEAGSEDPDSGSGWVWIWQP